MQDLRRGLIIPPGFLTLDPILTTSNGSSVNPLSAHRVWLMDIARAAGDRFFDPTTGRCLIARDTYWYAIALLFDTDPARRESGRRLFATLVPEDATHTPATLLAVLHAIPDRLDHDIISRCVALVRSGLPESAACELHDGNVNHPLGAYTALILGGERCGEAWAVELGYRRLRAFADRIGEHRGRHRRQAEMSEYNSLTYTALDLWFLALVAEYGQSAPARALALFLEQRLWIDVAMHFHAPSQQFAGPHSRSYAEDSIGGCSALHCTMLAAFDEPLFIEPALCYTYHHPSTLIQNALVAITPFHLPDQAREMAWHKPLPYAFRKTTYGESYHENSRRNVGGAKDQAAPFAFDDEIYPGGWSDLTTYMTQEYALGSASLPYVNAGHADSLMLRFRRGENIRALSDIRSAFTRGVFNGSRPGERNFCHVARTGIDESFLYEEGRSATYQHGNSVITCYTPKRAGHRGVASFRLDLLFTYHAPFDELLVDGTPVRDFPLTCPADARICFRDFRTFGLIIPLRPTPAASPRPVKIWRCGDFLAVSVYNHDGPVVDLERHIINSWWTGFVIELATADDLSWEQFVLRAATRRVEQRVHDGTQRTVHYMMDDNAMVFTYDPYTERILSRRWNGSPDNEEHMSVRAGNASTGPFCPVTLFGREAQP